MATRRKSSIPSGVIHNLVEDMVLRIVNEICDEDEGGPTSRYNTEPEYRMDAACFILNRIPQRYVSSARGQAHVEDSFRRDRQLEIDIVALAHEGLRRVTTTRRTFYGGETAEAAHFEGPGVSLPVIKGRLLHALTFDLVTGIEVKLCRDGELVEMIDSRWQNPYAVVGNAPGTYLFWPRPEPTGTSSSQGAVEFEVRVEEAGYEAFHHYFSIELATIRQPTDVLELAGEHRLPDLYLIPT